MFLSLRWLYKHLLEIGVFQTIHQLILRVAPDWFDPLDAGEVWSEEDY